METRGKRSICELPISATTPGSLREHVQAFLLERRIAGATGATVSTYSDQLRPFERWCSSIGLVAADLTTDHIRSYLATRRQVSSSALFEATRRLKTFFRWCHHEGICEDLSGRIRLPKQEHKVIPALTVAQVRALLAICSKSSFAGRRDEALVRLLIDCGLRISEALSLATSDIGADGKILVRYGKGQKQRVVPTGPRTQRALLRYMSLRRQQIVATDKLLIGTNGKALTRRHVEQHITRMAERAGIENIRVTPHVFRHTCALWFLQRGGDAFSIQALLGHSTLEMTKRYVNMMQSDVTAAHAKYGPGDLL